MRNYKPQAGTDLKPNHAVWPMKTVNASRLILTACASGIPLMCFSEGAIAACITTPGVSVQASASSACSAAGSYTGTQNSPAMLATGAGVISAPGAVVVPMVGPRGASVQGSGSQISMLGGLTLTYAGSGSGVRGIDVGNAGVITESGPLSITMNNGNNNIGIYAQDPNSMVTLGGDASISIGAGSAYAPGVRIVSGAQFIDNGALTIHTAGNSLSDAVAVGAGGSAQLNGALALNVSGQQASTLKATSGGTITYIGSASLNNTGVNGSGIRAVTGASITATATSSTVLQSSGLNSIGISVRDSGSQVNLAGPVSIQANGTTQANTPNGSTEPYAAGVLADAGGTLNSTGTLAITTSDASSSGVLLLGNNPSVSATGTGSIHAAGSTLSFLSGAAQSASFNGFSIISAAGDLVHTDAATSASLTLLNSTATGSSNLVQALNASSLLLTADNSTLTGNVISDATSAVTLGLQNNSSLTGSINSASLTVDSSSRWTMTGNSSLNNLTLAGTVNFQPSTSSPGFVPMNLAVNGNWVGQGGSVSLRTVLGNSSSPTDRIVISGGTASGNTSVRIANVGGAGGPTAGDGIEVVSAINGATTQANAFTLANRLVAGPYEYTLQRGGSTSADSWYLRNS